MTYQELMQSVNAGGSDRPDIARFSPDELRARELKQQQDFMALIEKYPLPQASGLRIVRPAQKAVQKLLGRKPGTKKPTGKQRDPDFVPMKEREGYLPRAQRGIKDGFKSVGAEEFHDLLGKVGSLDVEKKSLASLKDIVKVGGKLFRGVGKYEDAIYGINPGETENELFGVHVPKELRGSGAGTEITKDSRRRNLKIPGHKPLVGYAIKQTPEEGSYLDRFYTTGERGRRTHTYKYDPALADPERIKRGYAPSDVGRYQHSRVEPKEKMPSDWQNVGGPRSKLVQFGDGKIPGGLEGTFSFRDLVYMKANPFSLNNLTELERDQLYRKHALTMTRDLDDPFERLNTLVFGQLTGNSDLENSQLMLSRLRSRTMEDIQRLAAYIPEGKTWKTLSKPERTEISNRLIGDYNMQGRGEGGLGIAGSFDYSGVADLARQHLADPDFHKQIMGEPDREYIERLSNIIPGISQKTGSLAQLMLKPMTSEFGAMDRHMNRYFNLDPKKVGVPRTVIPSGAHPTHLTREDVPEYLKKIAPENLKSSRGGVQMMSDEYLRGNEMLRAEAEGAPFGPGMKQWQIWDTIRGHFDPHEQLYPGIHTMTERMPDRRIQEVRDTLAKAGHWSKTDPDNPHQFKPSPINPSRDAMYYGLLPLSKILNAFKPREPYQQMPVGTGYNTMQYGPGS
jgi:hypothetical protein